MSQKSCSHPKCWSPSPTAQETAVDDHSEFVLVVLAFTAASLNEILRLYCVLLGDVRVAYSSCSSIDVSPYLEPALSCTDSPSRLSLRCGSPGVACHWSMNSCGYSRQVERLIQNVPADRFGAVSNPKLFLSAAAVVDFQKGYLFLFPPSAVESLS